MVKKMKSNLVESTRMPSADGQRCVGPQMRDVSGECAPCERMANGRWQPRRRGRFGEGSGGEWESGSVSEWDWLSSDGVMVLVFMGVIVRDPLGHPTSEGGPYFYGFLWL